MTTTSDFPDFRPLCAKIVELWDADCDIDVEINELRELLATPPPEPSGPPTDAERLADFAQWLAREMPPSTIIGDPLWWAPRIACAVLERWGRSPAIEPVPVSERCPGPKDWDAEGRCWMFDPCDKGWWAYRSALPSDGDPAPFTYWLPHWALPLPQQAGEVQP
jgi:hypothetical protein